MMPILIPPAILGEVQAIFYLPVIAYAVVQIPWRNVSRIKARHKVTCFFRDNITQVVSALVIQANRNSNTRKTQGIAKVFGVFQVEP